MTKVVLAIDTATPAVLAGIVRRDGDSIDVLAERITVDPRAHAEQLTPNVLAALGDAGISVTDLDGNYESGAHPASEPETRAMMRFLTDVDPDYVLSFHQPLHGVDTDNKRPGFSRRVAWQ